MLEDLRVLDERVWLPFTRTCQEGEAEQQLVHLPGPPWERVERVCATGTREERAARAVVPCTAEPARVAATLPPGAGQDVTWSVHCPADATCDDTQDGWDWRTHCSLSLVGELRFTDPLGNVHRDPLRLLKQMLRLGEPGDLEVAYNPEVSAEHPFRAVATYLDAAKQALTPERGAQVSLRFEKMVGVMFSMHYDEAEGAFVFEEDDFTEWAPPLPPGANAFHIEAEAPGHETFHVGPYAFTLG